LPGGDAASFSIGGNDSDQLVLTAGVLDFETTPQSSSTCPVEVFNGITYWACSYDDNRVAMNYRRLRSEQQFLAADQQE